MVNCGDGMLPMIGSQFFFTLDEHLTYLDTDHCIFGEVTEGFEVLSKLLWPVLWNNNFFSYGLSHSNWLFYLLLGKINEAICDGTNRPYQDIRISHTVILEDPFDDPVGLNIPSRSPSPNPERMMVIWILL